MDRKNEASRKRKHIPQRECISCHELIKQEASICPHCGGFQNWQRHFVYWNLTIALLVALVSVVSMGIPLILQAIKPDNSELSIAFVPRADVMVSIIASNKGTRLAVMDGLATMKMTILDKNVEKKYIFFLKSISDAPNIIASRDSLAVPEGLSKQFYYQMALGDLYLEDFKKLASERNLTIENIQRCEFIVSYTNFDGKVGKESLVIFDRSKIKKTKNNLEYALRSLDSMDCLLKIPDPLREQYKLFMPEH